MTVDSGPYLRPTPPAGTGLVARVEDAPVWMQSAALGTVGAATFTSTQLLFTVRLQGRHPTQEVLSVVVSVVMGIVLALAWVLRVRRDSRRRPPALYGLTPSQRTALDGLAVNGPLPSDELSRRWAYEHVTWLLSTAWQAGQPWAAFLVPAMFLLQGALIPLARNSFLPTAVAIAVPYGTFYGLLLRRRRRILRRQRELQALVAARNGRLNVPS